MENKWIRVKDKLPEIRQEFFALLHIEGEPEVQIAYRPPFMFGDNPLFHTNRALWFGLESMEYWMPIELPEAPK